MYNEQVRMERKESAMQLQKECLKEDAVLEKNEGLQTAKDRIPIIRVKNLYKIYKVGKIRSTH